MTMYTFRTGHGTRAERLAALLNILRVDRKMSAIAARRYRLAMWVLGR